MLFVFTALVLIGSLAGAPQASSGDAKSIEARVDTLFAKWNNLSSPGAAAAVVKDGMVVYRKGFGCAQLEYGVPITPSTVFHVASVSKQFTAMAITMLEEEGKLSASDDIRKYLPEMADFGKTITIRHLLNHTSGLRDQWELLILSGWRMDDVITQEHIMDRLRRQRELNFPPGGRYLYCNSGFTLLAEITARVGGMPFTQWTREKIFEPLGMTSTRFHMDHEEIVANRAYSYQGDPATGYKNAVLSYANAGATSLFTTVEDMADWMRNFDEKRVGGEAVLARMLTKGVLNDGTEIDYARGISTGEYKGLKTFGHGGADAGFRSDVLYFPGEKFGVVVLSNLDSFNPGALARQIADIYLAGRLKEPEAAAPAGVKAPSGPEIKGPSGKTAKTKFPSAAALAEFVGSYWFETDQFLRTVVLDKGRLTYVRSANNSSELVPVSPTEFKMKDVEVRVAFSDKKGNRYETVNVTVGQGKPVVGKWMEPFAPAEGSLKEYAGFYISDELDTRYDLQVKSGALHVQVGHLGDMGLDPQKKDFFLVGDLGKIQFRRGGAGAITGFEISTGRVLNLKFRKLTS
jgi:CubicO group peptidase (beta-lactamase class C family)